MTVPDFLEVPYRPNNILEHCVADQWAEKIDTRHQQVALLGNVLFIGIENSIDRCVDKFREDGVFLGGD